MYGHEIIREIDRRLTDGQEFIRWWRRENDFADYERIEDFRRRVGSTMEYEGFELLDVEQMWATLVEMSAHRLVREKNGEEEIIIWEHVDSQGYVREITCPFNPEAIMTIFDVETKGYVLV